MNYLCIFAQKLKFLSIFLYNKISNRYPERIRIAIKILGGVILVATFNNGLLADYSFQQRRAMTTTKELNAKRDVNQDDHAMIQERETLGNTKNLLVTIQF